MNKLEESPIIVFFDVETNMPTRACPRLSILEFGAIAVCPRKLEELYSYSTLIQPKNKSSLTFGRSGGITHEAIAEAPSFDEVAGDVYNTLNGRIWAGHNIQRFDCVRIKEAFAEIGKPPPSPIGVIDSLDILTRKFGRRAGNMKMATLAAYFGLGKQKHRALEDARMNLEVLKNCATVLFLESSLPGMEDNLALRNNVMTTRSRYNGRQRSEDGKSFHVPLGCRRSFSRKRSGAVKAMPHTPERNGVQMGLYGALRSKQITTLIRHSHSLFR